MKRVGEDRAGSFGKIRGMEDQSVDLGICGEGIYGKTWH